MGNNRAQSESAQNQQRKQSHLHQPVAHENLVISKGKPSQRRQDRVQHQSHAKLPVQIGTRTFQALALTRPRLFVHSTLKSWCTGEGSNLRRSKDRQIYSLLPLTTRPPVLYHPTDEDLSAATPIKLPWPTRFYPIQHI